MNNGADRKNNVSRRDFIKTSAVVSAGVILSNVTGAYAAGSDKIRVGVIGCGGRGTGAAYDCMRSTSGVEIYAMGDLFADRLERSVKWLTDPSKTVVTKETFNVPKERQFVGFDAYQKVIDSGVDMVILAAPPGFRPVQLMAAVKAGKHVFMEKPAGVDPAGIRSVIKSSKLAKKKGLAIVAGTQRRHQKHYIDILKRVNDGQIGQIKSACCYWNGGDMIGYWKWYPKGNMSGMEWQCRSWPWFTWTSGDHYVEQHVHNIDVINWAIGDHPIKCMGMGGREVRTQGNIYDHFAVEYEYPNGVRVMSMARQINGCTSRVAEYVVGTEGIMETDGSKGQIKGKRAYTYDGPNPDPYVVEHTDLINSIRSGNPLNEGKRVAESTMCAIMGRMSAYTGRAMKWDWAMKASDLDLTPKKYDFAYDMPMRPIAVPGKTQLI
jgi:predicted dehydrogenase